MYYVYVHFQEDTGVPFYVGKGKKARYKRTTARSRYWQNIVAKHGFIPEIVSEHEAEAEAYDVEKALIKELGEQYPLCNLSSGGDGGYSIKRTPAHCAKITAMLLVRNRSEEHRKKVSSASLGKVHSAEALRKMSLAKTGVFGLRHNSFKGLIEARCLSTGQAVLYAGEFALEQAGFTSQLVYKVLSGNRTKHKDHTFRRLPHGDASVHSAGC